MKKITRADWQAEGWPYIPTRYAEIDAVIASRRCWNCIKDIGSDTVTAFPSDHFSVTIKINMKLAKTRNENKDKSNAWKGPKKPTEDQKSVFSEAIKAEMSEQVDISSLTDKERLNVKVGTLL